MPVLTILESVGVFVFAMSGAFTAIQKRMDLFGIYVLAGITAMGGGLCRDVIMDRGIPVFFSSYWNYVLIFGGATVMILLKGEMKWSSLVTFCDTVGMAVFAINAGIQAIEMGYNLPSFLFVAVITGVGGGVLRDMLCQRVPVIFKREIYAMAAVVGSIFLWATYYLLPRQLSVYLSAGLIVAIRIASLYWKYNLPVIWEKRK